MYISAALVTHNTIPVFKMKTVDFYCLCALILHRKQLKFVKGRERMLMSNAQLIEFCQLWLALFGVWKVIEILNHLFKKTKAKIQKWAKEYNDAEMSQFLNSVPDIPQPEQPEPQVYQTEWYCSRCHRVGLSRCVECEGWNIKRLKATHTVS